MSLNHPGEIFQEFSSKGTYRLRAKGGKMIFQANGNEKEGMQADRTDFRPKKVTRDKEGHFIRMKGSNIKKV